jgi:hypothetical protein
MKRLLVFVLLVVLAAGLMPGVASAEEAGSISGTVTEEGTGALLSGVYVYVMDLAGNWVAGTGSDVSGNFTVGGLPPGDYQVGFSASSYVSEFWNDRPNRPGPVAGDRVTVAQGADTAEVDAALVRAGSMSGTVIAAGTAAPIEGVQVSFCATWSDFCWGALTDAAGYYSITWLEPGDYRVQFSPQDPYAFVPEWWSDKPDSASADPVAVTGGANAVVNAVLSAPGSISGTVIAAGQPVAGVSVEVLNSVCSVYLGSGYTDADGKYMVGGLPTGTYKAVFYPDGLSPFVSEWWNDKPDCASADLVSVIAGAITWGIDPVLGRDADPPVVTVPDDMTVQATDPGGAVVEFSRVAAFDSDGRVWEHLDFQFGDNRLVRNPGSYNEHVEFRRAVAYAIDKDALVESIPEAALALDSYVEAYLPDWSQGLWAQYAYNPDMARFWLGQLCAKPGVDCVANPPKALFTTSTSPLREAMAGLFAPMFADVGIVFEAQLEDSSLFFGDTMTFGNYDLAEWAWGGAMDIQNLVDIHDVWDPEAPPPYGQNNGRWGTPAVTDAGLPDGYIQGPSSVINGSTARFAQVVDLMDAPRMRLLCGCWSTRRRVSSLTSWSSFRCSYEPIRESCRGRRALRHRDRCSPSASPR